MKPSITTIAAALVVVLALNDSLGGVWWWGAYADELELRKVVFLEKADIYNQDNSYNTTNYLFRGNEPKTTDSGKEVFAYSLLKTYLQNVSMENGFQLPPDYYLIDIKYVYDQNDILERDDVLMEMNFFKINAALGEARIESIFGDFTDPNLEEENERNNKAMNLSVWQKDNLPVRIPQLRELLFTRDFAKPVVIYFHCECGCDRTGEIGASYAMKYLGKTYVEAMAWDDKIADRPILPNHQFAVAWYCYYLQLVESMDVQCHDAFIAM